jgi:anti-sigma-K factor RskA
MTTDVHALAGAYVLDAVDDLERAAFDRHLAECESCRVEVAEMRAAAARLADGAWSAPPPRLRAVVLAAIGRTRQLPPGVTRAPRAAAAATSRWRRSAAAAAAAAILAAGAGTATYVVQEQRVREQSALAAAARAQAGRIQTILLAPDVQTRTGAVRGGGRVTVAMSPSHDAGVVMLAADWSPPAGRAFELWRIRGASPLPAGTLPAGESAAMTVVDGMAGTDRIAVTVEAAGGAKAPSGPAYAEVTLT